MNAKPRRKSARPILFASLLFFLIGILGGIATVVWFIAVMLPGMTHPITEFNANVEHTFDVPKTDERYVLSAVVPDRDSPLPPSDVTLTNSEGVTPEFEPENGWSEVFGRSYRRMIAFDPAGDTRFQITIEADPKERYAVFRHPQDVSSQVMAWVSPGALVSGLFLMGGVGGLLVFFVKSADQTELEPHP